MNGHENLGIHGLTIDGGGAAVTSKVYSRVTLPITSILSDKNQPAFLCLCVEPCARGR